MVARAYRVSRQLLSGWVALWLSGWVAPQLLPSWLPAALAAVVVDAAAAEEVVVEGAVVPEVVLLRLPPVELQVPEWAVVVQLILGWQVVQAGAGEEEDKDKDEQMWGPPLPNP